MTQLPPLEATLREGVHLILLLIEVTEREPEADAADGRQRGNGRVVPDEERIGREGSEGLADGIGDGAHKEENGRDERTHVPWRLGEGVLEPGDGGENLGEGDEEERDGLDPDIDGRWVHAQALIGGRIIVACAELVDVILDDCCCDHGSGSEKETPCNPFQGREPDPHAFKTWVQESVGNRDEDDEGDRVNVVD